MLAALVLAAATWLPTGQTLTPLAAPGASVQRLATGLRADGSADAGGAMALALSPDGTTLLALTSGYNYQFFDTAGKPIAFPVRDPLTGAATHVTSALTQWIFVYSVRAGSVRRVQRIAIPNAFDGIVWAPDGRRFYVSGGIDDRIAAYVFRGGRFVFDAPEILLGHDSKQRAPLPDYDGGILNATPAGRRASALGIGFGALAAGLAISGDGRTLAVANFQNDSISILDAATRRVRAEIPLFTPGSTAAHGEYPFAVAIRSRADGTLQEIYASAMRDGEIAAIAGGRPRFIALGGEPGALLLSRDGTMLYVANGDLDEVDVVDTRSDTLARRISVDRPGQRFRGANPNGLALDETAGRLYVSLGLENAVAVIDLAGGSVLGRIPTGWYPTAVALAGGALAVTDAKSPSGPNPGLEQYVATIGSPRHDPTHRDQYVLDLEKADLLTLPLPGTDALATLSARVDENDGFVAPPADAVMAALRGKIRHVIYIMKENRTYDQVLGDLRGANGDPSLTSFPYAIAPNHHELAKQFVTLDNFYTSGDVSGDGWNWSMQGHPNEYTARLTPIGYASDGISFDTNGVNRGTNTATPVRGGSTPFDARAATLLDPSGRSSILPGSKDVAATVGDSDDAPSATGGYIWDSALRAGRSVRQYGLYTDATFYKIGAPFYIPIERHAFARGVPQSPPDRPSLVGRTDRYYRGWDLNTPDRYRYEEWKREFDGYVARGDLPQFEVMCLMTDHFGQFDTNVGGLKTPFLEMSDDDYALGLLVEAVAHSPYWKDTAIFVLEDDAQDGPDHVDSHRSPAFVISAYTKRSTVVHTRYTTTAMLHTIEQLLEIDPLGSTDANAPAMSDVFSTVADTQDRYRAVLPGDLCAKPVKADLIPECAAKDRARTAALLPRRGPAWWAAQTKGMDFDRPDALDPARFNALLETGLR